VIADYLPLLAALVALLVGLAAGKAWERYKLHEGRWIDRRKARQSPHYIQGLNFLVANQLDHAIEELSQAARVDEDAVEIHMILGNLYREKGQVGRAIQIHQQILQRPRLSRLEHTYALLCLGLDFKRGGFVDRSHEAFGEVLRLDPSNEHALLQLQKLYEDQHQWADAYRVRQDLVRDSDPDNTRARHDLILAFLENEIGMEALGRGDLDEAARRFEAAIDLSEGCVPAFVHLGDVLQKKGDLPAAVLIWERLVATHPLRAHLVADRLSDAYIEGGRPDAFEHLFRRLTVDHPQDWRARIALARHLHKASRHQEGLQLILGALAINPHALLVHQLAWDTLLALDLDREAVRRYVDQSRDAVFYRDPHVCLRCRYRSKELLWRCPQCHEWDSFVEERLAPARASVDDNDG
jgi:lipopolysaccharide biosynthesis regulator YciM